MLLTGNARVSTPHLLLWARWLFIYFIMFKYSYKALYFIHPSVHHPSSHSAIWIIAFPDYLNNLSPDSKEYEDTQGKPAEATYRSILLLPECGQMSVIIFVCLSVPAAAALVIVSEVSDEANDNLKQGVGLHWTRSNTNDYTARCVYQREERLDLRFPCCKYTSEGLFSLHGSFNKARAS